MDGLKNSASSSIIYVEGIGTLIHDLIPAFTLKVLVSFVSF